MLLFSHFLCGKTRYKQNDKNNLNFFFFFLYLCNYVDETVERGHCNAAYVCVLKSLDML